MELGTKVLIQDIINSSPTSAAYISVNGVSIGSDNGLAPNRCWVIVNWTLRNKIQWNFNQKFVFTKMHLKISSAKWQTSCPGGDKLNYCSPAMWYQHTSALGQHWFRKSPKYELEQLERLRSEDTPLRLMITHTIESYWIPSQKKTKSKLQI